MKRAFFLLMLLTAVLFLAACAGQTELISGDFALYYIADGEETDQVLQPVPLESVRPEMELPEVLESLRRPPADRPGLRSALQNVVLQGWNMEGEQAALVFSEEYGRLAALDRTLLNAAVTLTLLQFENISGVSITWEGAAEAPVVLNADSFELYQDRGGALETLITLYFANADCRYLVPESQTLVLYESEAIERFIVEELIRGPKDGSHGALIPADAELLDIRTEKGICYVDLSAAFYRQIPQSCITHRLVIYSIVNSLTERGNIEKVHFLMEGQPVERYGCVPLAAALTREERLIRADNGSIGYADLTVYVKQSNLNYVTPLALMVPRSEYAGLEQLVAETLLEMEPLQFCERLFPDGTELISISVISRVCTLDFNEAFLDHSTAEQMAGCVYALTASLTELNTVDRVRITINNQIVQDALFDLSEPISGDQVVKSA